MQILNFDGNCQNHENGGGFSQGMTCGDILRTDFFIPHIFKKQLLRQKKLAIKRWRYVCVFKSAEFSIGNFSELNLHFLGNNFKK